MLLVCSPRIPVVVDPLHYHIAAGIYYLIERQSRQQNKYGKKAVKNTSNSTHSQSILPLTPFFLLSVYTFLFSCPAHPLCVVVLDREFYWSASETSSHSLANLSVCNQQPSATAHLLPLSSFPLTVHILSLHSSEEEDLMCDRFRLLWSDIDRRRRYHFRSWRVVEKKRKKRWHCFVAAVRAFAHLFFCLHMLDLLETSNFKNWQTFILESQSSKLMPIRKLLPIVGFIFSLLLLLFFQSN